MSYLRMSQDLKYVDGKSKDYIFAFKCGVGRKGFEDYSGIFGKKYDTGIDDSSLVELVCKALVGNRVGDADLADYLIWRLAQRLKVKLRKKPLSDKQLTKLALMKYDRKKK